MRLNLNHYKDADKHFYFYPKKSKKEQGKPYYQPFGVDPWDYLGHGDFCLRGIGVKSREGV